MDLRDTPDEAAFRAELRAWLEANLPEDKRGSRGGSQRFDDAFGREWSRKLFEGGYAGLTWPKEYGGAGAPYSYQAIFLEEMAHAQAPPHVGVIGLGISVYLTTLHYAGVAPLCSSGGFVNCEGVLKSQYSVVPGTTIPVTVPGMVWFIVSAALALVSIRCARQGSAEPRWLRPGHLIWALLGLASVLYFVYDELVQLHELCEWCTSVHVLVFLSLLVTLGRLQSGGTAAYEGTG